MLRFKIALMLLAFAPTAQAENPFATAIDNQPRVWRALSGDLMELDGREIQLKGVRCPAPSTDKGRDAKALLNTFLSSGRLVCKISETANGLQAVCTKEGRSIATGMLASNLCQPGLTGDGPEEEASRYAKPVIATLETAPRDRSGIRARICRKISQFQRRDMRFKSRCTAERLAEKSARQLERQLKR